MSADIYPADIGLSSPLLFALTVEVDDFQREWSRCNLLANYVGEYIAYQFTQRERAENLISTITNEFLESVIALAPGTSRLSLSYHHTSGQLAMDVEHHVHPGVQHAYLDFLVRLDREQSRQQYLDLLIADAQPTDAFNQLGLTMLTHDFGVQFSAQFMGGNDCLKTQLLIPIEALTA